MSNDNKLLTCCFIMYFIRMVAVSGIGECSDDHPQTRLRVGEEIIEMSDDNEISVTLEDVGEDEATVEGGQERSQGKGVMKGATLMRACGHGRVCKRKATTVS